MFPKIIENSDYYDAPWCEACQKTMPEIEKLGELYKNKKNVVIAKMNSVNNEIFELPILDVPTIALFIEGSRKPIYHTADERTANSFSEFITLNLEKNKKNNVENSEKKNEKEKASNTKKQPENKDKEQLQNKDEL
ncbi:unnamed protein product [Onchocerca flexuosa]|uniref:Thioredoxin domain-containing protein n=1 Tax=Onchocerca flexuosa TaxID=387005 RepID=A0A183HFD8_9BILA|nr:unnamed protein product [Onchocerca flexuosa]